MSQPEFDQDYTNFINSRGLVPPPKLDYKILNFVHADLDPGHAIVFLKLISIQGLIGVLTMLFCPQFNFSLTNNYDLFHYFHHTFGASMCMALCGLIFVGSGAIFASYTLSNNEINKIKELRLLYFMSVTALLLSVFIMVGASFYLKLIAFWFLGAVIGGITLFELNSLVRQKIQQHYSAAS